MQTSRIKKKVLNFFFVLKNNKISVTKFPVLLSYLFFRPLQSLKCYLEITKLHKYFADIEIACHYEIRAKK